MKPTWTDHALARAYERGAAWQMFRDEIDRLADSETWEIWYEVDSRHGRGLQTNHVVRTSDGTVAVLRTDRFPDPGERPRKFVISVITARQASRNERALWAKTPAAAELLYRRREEARLAGRPLTHTPLARLVNRR